MGSARRDMTDVVLDDDDAPHARAHPAVATDVATESGTRDPLDTPRPTQDRHLAWRRRGQRWWPVAVLLALILVTTSVDANNRQTRRLAAFADVPGVLAPLDGSITERWRSAAAQFWLVGTTAELLIGTLDRPDGSAAVVGLAATTGDVVWEVATRPAGAANYGTECVVAEVDVICVLVDETRDVQVSDAGVTSFPSAARLLVLDVSNGAVLSQGPTDPSTAISSAGGDLVIGRLQRDGRYQVSRTRAWDAPARWSFATDDARGASPFVHRTVRLAATGDLVQVESWTISGELSTRSSWVLGPDGSAVRSMKGAGSGARGGFGVLRRGQLLTEPPVTYGSGRTLLTDLATGSSFRVDAAPFDALPDDGSLDDLVLAQALEGGDLIAYTRAGGRQLWTVSSPSVSGTMVIEGRIIRAETDRLVSIDGDTGETVWSTPIDEVRAVATDGSVVLLAGTEPSGSVEVTAYGLDDGRERWSRTLPREVRWLFEADGALYGQSEQSILALG